MTRATKALTDVGAIVDAKSPADSKAFRKFFMGIAQRVAEASKEGAFLELAVNV